MKRREYGIELLHARAFQRALEGDLETVYYMGKPVGYIRKFSDKLQIEMLRAYKPDVFKTAGVNVNIGTKRDVFVLTEEQRHRLTEVNREFLLTAPLQTEEAPALQNCNAQPQRLTHDEASEPTP